MSDLRFTGRDGIPIEPLYTEPVAIDVPAREGPWEIRPQVRSLEQAREEIAGGADSLWWIGGDAPPGLGVPVVDRRSRVVGDDSVPLLNPDDLRELSAVMEADTDVEEVRISIGRDVFKSIAKIRALRYLWIERTGENPFIHAVGSWRTLTRYDAHTNIIRQTTQAFAAAVGGADAITVWGYDAAGAEPSDLGRRIARNTQLILRCESGLDEIADPAKGSYYLDWLTREFVDRAGADRSTSRFAFEPIVGVTDYPLAGDSPLAPPRDEGLPDPRDAAEFEALRDQPADPLYLCKLGTLREHREEAAFARKLFVTGGFEVIEGEGPDGFAESGAGIACVVGPGEVDFPGAKRVLRDLDPELDKLSFLKELRG